VNNCLTSLPTAECVREVRYSSPDAPLRVCARRYRISRMGFLYWIGVCFLLSAVVVYHFTLVKPAIEEYTLEDTFSTIANIHDHYEYTDGILVFDELAFENPLYWLNNVMGLSSIYYFLGSLFETDDYIYISIYVNSFALIGVAYLHFIISPQISDHPHLRFTFFLNFPLIYFCQLVGKEVLYLAVLYGILFFYLRKKWVGALCVGMAGLFVRTQILLVLAFLVLLSVNKIKGKVRFLIAYFFSGVLGTLVLLGGQVIGKEADLGDGVSAIVYQLNERLYLGNLLLNPIRLMQYIWEFSRSALLSLTPNINPISLFLIPYFLYFLLKFGKFSRLTNLEKNPVSRFSLTLLFVLMIVPIVNLRYLIIILPFIVLAMNYKAKEN
jgi:hypothetical protein